MPGLTGSTVVGKSDRGHERQDSNVRSKQVIYLSIYAGGPLPGWIDSDFFDFARVMVGQVA